MAVQRVIEAGDSLDEIYQTYTERNLTDGLPIIPPTPARVEAMLKAVDRDPQEVLGAVPPKWAPASIQKVAVNAVMAGCRPEYFPVVVAAVECVVEESFNLYGVQATTNPVSPCVVVNGPIRNELKVNCGYNVLGEGNRPNATIGRALRLVLRNIGGGIPGELDRSTTGWAGRYAACFGELEERNPWDTFSMDRGFARDANVVTVFGIGGQVNLGDHHSTTGRGLLLHLSRVLANGAGDPYSAAPIIVLCPEFVELLVEDGFNKQDVKKFLYENARVRPSGMTEAVAEEWVRVRNNRIRNSGSGQPEITTDSWVPFATSVERISIIVAGGAGRHSVLLNPCFGTEMVSKEIRR